MSIFNDTDVSARSVKGFQTSKQTAMEYFPDLTTVVVSFYQKDKSYIQKTKEIWKSTLSNPHIRRNISLCNVTNCGQVKKNTVLKETASCTLRIAESLYTFRCLQLHVFTRAMLKFFFQFLSEEYVTTTPKKEQNPENYILRLFRTRRRPRSKHPIQMFVTVFCLTELAPQLNALEPEILIKLNLKKQFLPHGRKVESLSQRPT